MSAERKTYGYVYTSEILVFIASKFGFIALKNGRPGDRIVGRMSNGLNRNDCSKPVETRPALRLKLKNGDMQKISNVGVALCGYILGAQRYCLVDRVT
jgi:hypothetical protein